MSVGENKLLRKSYLEKLKQIRRWLNIAHWIIGRPMLAYLLLFSLPVIGNVVAGLALGSLDCTGGGGSAPTCFLLGKDVGEVLYGYVIGMFLLGMINPFLAWQLLSVFLPGSLAMAWIVLAILLGSANYAFKRVIRDMERSG